MKRIEAQTLEEAYAQAAETFGCSVTALQVEIVQFPSKGFLGLFKKSAVIIANLPHRETPLNNTPPPPEPILETETDEPDATSSSMIYASESYVTEQDDDEEEYYDEEYSLGLTLEECAVEVQQKINALFETACFEIDEIKVSVYDDNTLLVEFSGPDAALLIGKEGYRYKALSYMLFNWINAEYQCQLRLEVAEFLKNQEESISRYLIGVYDTVERDGRAQTKILDGVLVQIALKQLRDRYPDRYVAIRSTRDGGKFVVINSYHEY